MRIVGEIENRLQKNAIQRRMINQNGYEISRQEEIRLEYLAIEAQTFNQMLDRLRNRRWTLLRNKKFAFFMSIVAMSLYVVGIFYMFKELDLSKVEQWQFAVTALPFWLIVILIPLAVITLLTSRNTH
jgi:hypothetical protein